MTARSALTVVGQVVGAYFGGSFGAAIGGMIGGAIGGAIDGPVRTQQNLIDDLNAIKFDYGSAWPRIYGTYRFKISPMWTSKKRPIAHEHEQSDKGGPTAVNTTFTYVQDWLCWAPLNAKGFLRVWINGELKYSRLGDASDKTLVASANTTAWTSITFFDGNPTQMPWAIYEADPDIGADNAVAFRDRPTLGIESLDLGGSGQPPLVEVEYFSDATEEDARLGDGLLCHFDAYRGASTSVIVSSRGPDVQIVGPADDATLQSDDFKWTPQAGLADSDYANYSFAATGVTGRLDRNWRAEMWLNPSANEVAYFLLSGSGLSVSLGGSLFGAFGSDWTTLASTGGGYFGDPADRRPVIGQWNHLGMQWDNDLKTLKWFVNGRLGDVWIAIPGIDLFGSAVFTDIAIGGPGALVDDFYFHFLDDRDALYQDGYQIPQAPFSAASTAVARATALTVQLADIVTDECLLEWSGVPGALTAADIDVTDLADVEVTGFATVGSPREAVGSLADGFYFGSVCSDKVYFRMRGAEAVGTVPFAHTGIGVGQPADPFTGLERGNDLEVPVQVAVTGPNILADYEPGTENSDRLVGESVELRRYSTPIVFTPAQRKGRADTMVLDGRAATHVGKVILDDRHVAKEPFDVWIQVDDRGNQYRVRADRESFGDGIHAFDVVLDDASVLSSLGIATARDQRAVIVADPASTATQLLLDVPILRDADNDPGFYDLVKPGATAGASVYSSPDDIVLTNEGLVTQVAVFGVAQTTLGAWTGPRIVDEKNSVTVNVGSTAVLASSTRDIVLADQTINAFAIGVDGRWELGQFVEATLIGAGIYKLSRLLRGSRGTEWAMTGHVADEKFALLKNGGTRRIPMTTTQLGTERFYRVVSIGRATDSATSQRFTNHGVGVTPFSPVDLRIAKLPNSDIVLAWTRRTRLATRFAGPAGISAPLGEATESYVINILTGVGGAVKRTYTSSTPTVTYPVADQTADFGVPPSVVYARVRQVSALVGAGYPLEGALLVPVGGTSGGGGGSSEEIHIFGLRPVMEIGGVLLAATYRSAYTSTDDGKTYTLARDDTPEVNVAGVRFFDAKVGTQRISIGLNAAANFGGLIVASDDPAATNVEYSSDPAGASWTTTGYPRAGGLPLATGALASDGTYYYIVGRLANGSQPNHAMYLYRADTSLDFSLQGQLVHDLADPNGIAAGQTGSFEAEWFTPLDPDVFKAYCKLLKFGSRWFLSSALALYYTDDSSALTGWRRCPTGFQEEVAKYPPSALGSPIQIGSTLLILGVTGSPGAQTIAKSNDNGSTWTLIATTDFASTGYLIAFGNTSLSGHLLNSTYGLRMIGSEYVGIIDQTPPTFGSGKSLVRYDSAGVFVAASPTLGKEILQWDHIGDDLYLVTADYSSTPPFVFTSSRIIKVARATLGSVAATYSAPTLGDPGGVACDGTNVWMTERINGNLRKLNAGSLASAATYSLGAGIGALRHDSGSLWIVHSIVNGGSADEIIEWDVSGAVEVQRFPVIASPFDVLIAGGLAYVIGPEAIGVYDTTTGAELTTIVNHTPYTLPMRALCTFGSYIAASKADGVILLDAATGDFVQSIEPGTSTTPYYFFIAGVVGTTIYLTVGGPGVSAETYGYELTATSSIAQVIGNTIVHSSPPPFTTWTSRPVATPHGNLNNLFVAGNNLVAEDNSTLVYSSDGIHFIPASLA